LSKSAVEDKFLDSKKSVNFFTSWIETKDEFVPPTYFDRCFSALLIRL
jgi:hypothetical protein